MRVETYSYTVRGRHVRWATRVILDNGEVIDYTEKMSKKQAINQTLDRIPDLENQLAFAIYTNDKAREAELKIRLESLIQGARAFLA